MYPPNDPQREQYLRMRAAVRVARKRAFMLSATVLGSLIVLNLFLYSSTHSMMFLLLDAVFAVSLGVRGWMAFGPNDGEEAQIRREMERMRGQGQGWNQGQGQDQTWR